MHIFKSLNVDWMGKRKMFYLLSTTIFLIGLVNFFIRGLQFGIDFRGGTELELQANQPVDINTIRQTLENSGLGELEVKMFGGDRNILLRTDLQNIPANIFPKIQATLEKAMDESLAGIPKSVKEKNVSTIVYEFSNPDTTNIVIEKLLALGFQAGKVSEEVTNKQMLVRLGIADWVKENLKTKLPQYGFTIRRTEVIGPKVGNELKVDAVRAIFFSLLGILAYLAIRYKPIFAVGAVVALFHDVLITLGLFAVLYGLIPGLNLEINLTIVAAFLTLIGYSVMDTVIVFDRVRETIRLHKSESLETLMNLSINKTMSRTILTGGTTLLSCIVLLIFGGEVLRSFAFTLTFGIVIGTYSSVFVASAMVLDYANKTKSKINF
ncbi:MAG: protein translocase subunit SecF [Ignavibacteria bacterium]|nr:protein translocase subunit SecF [Ignavibacteria bacterium]